MEGKQDYSSEETRQARLQTGESMETDLITGYVRQIYGRSHGREVILCGRGA